MVVPGLKISRSHDEIMDDIYKLGNEARDLELKIRELQAKKEIIDHLRDVLLHDLLNLNLHYP